jgi:hypothetical protein
MGGEEAARWLYDVLYQLRDGEFVELSDRERAHLVEHIERTLAQYEEATSYPSERPATTPGETTQRHTVRQRRLESRLAPEQPRDDSA